MISFDQHGNIPPGIHQYTYLEFRQQFVEEFPTSNTRTEIHQLSFLWLGEVRRYIQPVEVWVNGGFISNELNPPLIEMCLFIHPYALDEKKSYECLQLLNNAMSYRSRCYFGFRNSEKPLVSLAIGPYYWTEQLGFDAQQIPKGIVLLPWDEITAALD
ncbi:DUF6932 family protein [Ammoniphilus resinae]|uniref:Uncharacterized protein n=1 Tax=Ammoniphilus resinae TaxID=861532 RepID=A0ABS4GTW1_9BACL|nr:hypothetical protein [Ammoniphilus resinae]MBP1933721.1 hypothetical protein [Ammoniphilus resinae]